METAVTAEGQVLIPERVRRHLRLAPGTAVSFSVEADGSVVLRRAEPYVQRKIAWEKARGMAGPGPSTDEVMRMLRGDDWGRS